MWFDLNGLNVDCDIPVCHARPGDDARPADLRIRRRGIRPVPPEIAEGVLLQGVAVDVRPLYTTVRRADGSVLLRLHDRADFEISADACEVSVWADPVCPDEMLGIFVAGNLVSTVLALLGETVLHASAVEIDGRAVAFVADSGAGKSTLAALCCGRGARFVTDDVLRFHPGPDGGIWCRPGAIENRLRREMADLLDDRASAQTRTSADGRTVWCPPRSERDRCRLDAIVLPRPERTGAGFAISRLGPGTAVLELSRRPRLLGWRDREVLGRTFANLSELARVVPVFTARVPWGPPFDGAAIDELLAATVRTLDTPLPAA